MTWPGWLALALALVLMAAPSPVAERAGALADRGRLVSGDDAHGGGRLLTWAGVRGVAVPVAAAAVVAVALAGGPLLAIAAAAVLGTVFVLVGDVLGRRATAARHRDLLLALRVLVGELEVGSAPAAALGAAAVAGPRVEAIFAAAAVEAGRGGDAGAVLAGAVDRDVRVIGLAWQLGDATGAALAGVLTRVAADLGADDEQRRTVATVLAGPRSSATLLAGLPLLGIALGASMGARPVPFLILAPAGRMLCCAGVLLDVAGVLWMRRILRRAERA